MSQFLFLLRLPIQFRALCSGTCLGHAFSSPGTTMGKGWLWNGLLFIGRRWRWCGVVRNHECLLSFSETSQILYEQVLGLSYQPKGGRQEERRGSPEAGQVGAGCPILE